MAVITILVAVGLAAPLLGATSASAGTYVVWQCGPNRGPLDPPSWHRWPEGLIHPVMNVHGCLMGTELRIGTGRTVVPFGAGGYWRFEAPPGTMLWSFSAEVRSVREANGALQPVIISPSSGRTLLGPSAFPSNEQSGWLALDRLNVKDLAFGLRCASSSGCNTGAAVLSANHIPLGIVDNVPPSIFAKRPPPAHWVSRGVVPVEFGASDNVGIQRLAVSVDGDPVAVSNAACYDRTRNNKVRPCADANDTVAAELPVNPLSNGEHTITVTARDVGDLETTYRTRVLVDREAPSVPRRLAAAEGERWRNENRFDVSWVNPPEGGAPIAGAEYAFCPARNGPYDAEGCVTRRGHQPHSDTLAAPHDGEWSLRVALRDAAGNSDPSHAAVVEPLRLDTAAPQGHFRAFDPQDPLRILLSADDALSGVAHVEMEIRREGESTWRALTVHGSDRSYSAFADDAQHPAGTYLVRARVTDRAGNERSITALENGAPLRLGLPLRSPSSIVVGKPTRKRVKSSSGARPRYERVLLDRPSAAFGAHVALTGKVTDAASNPRANVAVDVLERVDLPGREWLHVANVHTRANGAFTYRAKPGPARVVRFAYPGSALTQPGVNDVELRVRAAVTIRPDRRRARNGGVVAFTGRLRSTPIPSNGKVLALQALTNRGWRTFATPRARARDGRWRFTYRFTGTSVRSRYSFRVVSLAEAGYPYAQGHSKTTSVVVDP